jgi:Ca-activated chloride channel family protein
MSGVHHFGFTAPVFLLVLLAVPLLLWIFRRHPRYPVVYTNLETLARIAARRGTWRRWLPIALLSLALAAAAAALAQPHIRRIAQSRGATIVLVADVSGSMEASDIRPSRLVAAVNGMRQFLDAVPKTDKVGLLAFGDTVEVLSAPTVDRAPVESNLGVLNPEGGTALGTAVESAVRVVVTSLAADGVRRRPGQALPAAIVLESDGAQDRGTISPFAAARMAKAAGIPIFGVTLGTRHGYITQGSGALSVRVRAAPDPGVIALLARETGGQSYSATSADQLDTIYRKLGTSVSRLPDSTDITSWFELVAAALIVAGAAASRVVGGVLP